MQCGCNDSCGFSGPGCGSPGSRGGSPDAFDGNYNDDNSVYETDYNNNTFSKTELLDYLKMILAIGLLLLIGYCFSDYTKLIIENKYVSYVTLKIGIFALIGFLGGGLLCALFDIMLACIIGSLSMVLMIFMTPFVLQIPVVLFFTTVVAGYLFYQFLKGVKE